MKKNTLPPSKIKKQNQKKKKFNFYWIYLLIFLVFIGLQFFATNSMMENIGWRKFETDLFSQKLVEKVVVVNAEHVEIYLSEEALKREEFEKIRKTPLTKTPNLGPHFKMTIGSIETFEKKLEDAQKDFEDSNKIYPEYEIRESWFGEALSWLFFLGIILFIWMFAFRRMGGGGAGAGNIFNIGKSKAKLADKDTMVKVTFKDVAGQEGAKEELNEIVDFLKNPKKYTTLGGKIPKGALLVGPPGTGKTLLAKAIAGEASVPFFSLSGSDFVEMFVGVGAARVRDLFGQAKAKKPCIIFIDELDAIGRARGKSASFAANDERENTLNQLLTEMDGFTENSGVILIAATNRPEILDSALLRPGRFDRQIQVDLPDLKEREETFKVHTKKLKVGKSVDIQFFAKQTAGFSGADIANVCNESALIAARKAKKSITKEDFLSAIDRIIGGLEKKHSLVSPQERKTIAVHESGHATVSWFLKHAEALVKVSIVPRGQSLGAAWYLPEDRKIVFTEQIEDSICMALGGRAAEEVIIGRISTGALSDLEKVTKQAYAMVAYYGLNNKVGNVSFVSLNQPGDPGFTKPYSEKTAQIIDEEVQKLIEKQYLKAKKIITEHKEKLLLLSNTLMEKEVIFSEDLKKIYGVAAESEKYQKNLQKEVEKEKAEKMAQKAKA